MHPGQVKTTARDMADRKNDLYLFSYDDTIAQDEDSTSSRAVPQEEAEDISWITMGLANSSLRQQKKEDFTRMIPSKHRTFAKDPEFPGKTDLIKLKIDTGEEHPIAQSPRRIPYSQEDFLMKKLESWQRAKIIRPSPYTWTVPIVIVQQKGKYRLTIDYRALNAILRNE